MDTGVRASVVGPLVLSGGERRRILAAQAAWVTQVAFHCVQYFFILEPNLPTEGLRHMQTLDGLR